MERIDEKLDWKEIKQYGKGVIIGTLLGLIITPNQLRDKVYREYVVNRISNHMVNLNDYSKNELLESAIKSVIRKVESSEYITNKEYIINRLNNIQYKEYKSHHFMKISNLDEDHDGVEMAYFYDPNSDIDYIMVNMETEHKTPILTYIHELNHLVDEHSEFNNKINPIDLIISDVSVEDYEKFFEKWPKVKKGDSYISIGRPLYDFTFGEKGDYYSSNSEIFARLSVMKSFMVDKGIIGDIKDKITMKDVEKLRSYAHRIYIDNEEEYVKFITNDFVLYLPLINWDKVDELNLIVSNDSNHTNDLT